MPILKLPSPVPGPTSLSELRMAVSGLALQATQAVSAVRGAFVAGSAPVQTVGSGSTADYVSRFGGTGVAGALVRSTSRLGLKTATGGTVVLPPAPEIDQAELGSSPLVGVGDANYARIVISLPVDQLARAPYVRLLRADVGTNGAPRPSSTVISELPLPSRTKLSDPIGNAASRLESLGAGSQLSLFVKDDAFSPMRTAVSAGAPRPQPPAVNTNRGLPPQDALISIPNVDPGVLRNVTFFLNSRASTRMPAPRTPLAVGQRQGINVLAGSSVSASPQIPVTPGNSAQFREVARVSTSLRPVIGSYAELEVLDRTVVYGRSYVYYATCLGESGLEGPRSRMVRVDVMRLDPPPPPVVMYSLVAGRPRFVALCTGSDIDHVEVYRRGAGTPELVRLLGTDRAIVTDGPASTTVAGFVHIGDISVASGKSMAYVDPDVLPGQGLEYRLYSVDAYGLKCQTPFSCSIDVPDPTRRVPLGIPTILAEQGVTPRTVSVTVSCDDPRVSSFSISRREVGTGEAAFHSPTDPSANVLGRTNPIRAGSRSGASLRWSGKAWLGALVGTSGSAGIVDSAVGYDRYYQYSVVGIDVRGNETSRVLSQVISPRVKPVADPPVGLSASVLIGQDGVPTGVQLTWTPGTDDFSPGDLVGDQDVLAASAVRTVFQVERRQLGSPSWTVMPATTASAFVDPVSTAPSPSFRPPYATVGAEYEYRVIAMQTGGYVSPHTDPVGIVVAPSVGPLGRVWVRSSGLATRPARVVVSWSSQTDLVEGWHVERAVTNKVFGSRIVSADSDDARSLSYSRVGEVKPESSRALGVSASATLDPTVYVGDTFYVDSSVDPANSYFYRVRTVDLAGRVSDWTYAGIILTDSPHDRKLYSVLSDDEKVSLASDSRPISSWRPT